MDFKKHEELWSIQAQKLNWREPFLKTLEWNPPFAKWFVGGKINACENCLDRHIVAGRGAQKAIVFESEAGEVRTLTYSELLQGVLQISKMLQDSGIHAGDCVAIYMPLVPEAVMAMLACARIGATHNVVFAGFSVESLRDRILDSQCKAVITAPGAYRKGQWLDLRSTVEQAVKQCACTQAIFTLETIFPKTSLEDLMKPAAFAAEHPLFVLYTSGTTGKPKGIVHSTGGYLTQVHATMDWVFGPQETDIYWCTADVGWITGHSYGLYGPLSHGMTLFMYEGAPLYPTPGRFWEMIERHRISILYTAPTAIRMLMQAGDQWPQKQDLSSLRLLGSVGEPINPDAWNWYSSVIGGGRCPIIDTWWQTETGAIMISPQAGQVSYKPGSATKPLPGIEADVVEGYLVIKKPWPSMTLGILGDPERFQNTYWSQMPGCYFTGDGARKDSEGDFWISGRVDDVLKIAGHRLGTAEIESAVGQHPAVAESAVVAKPDALKGQMAVVFVSLKTGEKPSEDLKKAIQSCVAEHLGHFAKPGEIRFVEKLPKTRSGKIMRRLLRELVNQGQIQGDQTTLEDPNALALLQGES